MASDQPSQASNERYRGSSSEREAIRQALEARRARTPDFSDLGMSAVSLENAFTSPAPLGLDEEFFWTVVEACERSLGDETDRFALVPPARFYVGYGANGARFEGARDSGGFHSQAAMGYQYLDGFGFAVALHPRPYPTDTLRTLELARSYLHDSLHASTFRSFRFAPVSEAEEQVLYRDQYGFNFRRSNGTSYSPPDDKDDHPIRINLNRLMDGITMLKLATLLGDATRAVIPELRTPSEEEVAYDLLAMTHRLPYGSGAEFFHTSVTEPARQFIAYWGGERLMEMLFTSMMTGKMGRLMTYFNATTLTASAWMKLFRSSSWKAASDGHMPKRSGRLSRFDTPLTDRLFDPVPRWIEYQPSSA